MSRFSVRIHSNPSFDEPTKCTHVNLAENDVGTLIAYRCSEKDSKGVTPWMVVRIGHSGRHFLDCVPLAGSDDKPSFGDMRPLSWSASRIIGCYQEPASQTFADLYRDLVVELRETEGAGAVVRFLSEAAGDQGDLNADAWMTQLDGLPPADRALVLRSLCPTLRDEGSSAPRYIRAARLCDLADPAIADSALERVRKGFAAVGGAGTYEDVSFYLAAPIAMRSHRAEVAAASCAFLGKPVYDGRQTTAFQAIAAAKEPCPAVTGAIEHLCDEKIDCDGGLCTEAMLRPALQAWLDQAGPLDGGSRLWTSDMSPERAKLAAGWAQGPLPAGVMLSNARRGYAIDAGSGTPCLDPAAAGAPCHCDWTPRAYDLCTVPLDGGRVVMSQCSFGVDDKKRIIGDVRHVCSGAGTVCGNDYDCCIGLECKSGETDPRHCIAR